MAKRSTRKADTPTRQLVRRLGIAAGVIAVTWYFVQGGEWSTVDLVKQRTRYDRLQQQVLRLDRDVDSLRKELKSVSTDKARIEQIAREEFGMVRGSKELLYWFRDADSTSAARTPMATPRG